MHVQNQMGLRQGFTLVELSIVLVILGLLVGGVLSGQSLIRSAELRSVTTQYNQFTTAMNSFRDKYFGWPGDITNATAFWGTSTACSGTSTAATATCNGDGNNLYVPVNSFETFTLWKQLANAGLIEGTYSGVAEGSQPYSATLNNSWKGKIGSSIWWVWSWSTAPWIPTTVTFSGDTYFFDGTYMNMLELGQVSGMEPSGFMTPADVWNIDMKVDDGKPGTGTMVTRAWSLCTNATASNQASTAAYLLTSTNKSCGPFFRLAM